jgi:hypothetical protein
MVPVTSAILLCDAEMALRRVAQDRELTTLEVAFLRWLHGEAAPPALDDVFSSALRDYSDVALGALGEAAGWSVDSAQLEDGLQWLVDIALERAGVPPPVVGDGLAHVCLGLAARSRPWLASWHDKVLAIAGASMTPPWLAGGGRVARGEMSACAPELLLALASRGAAVSTDADASALLEGLLRGQLPDDAFHAHVMLAALEWMRRSAPVVVPGHATVAAVATMLRAVPRALQQWPWGDETPNANRKTPAARWQIADEYHVQSLLWALLAPVFPDLKREVYAAPVGPIQPRVDLLIPSLRLVIEVKFARTRSALKSLIKEIGEDDQLLVFVWDNGRNQQDHDQVATGMRKLPHVVDAIIVSRPGHMTEPVPSDAGDGAGT